MRKNGAKRWKNGSVSVKTNFSRKIWKKPLAVFLSWGIFLPVAGDEPNDDNRRPLSSGKSKAKTKIKNFEKSS
jgi:hypothetical protein